MAATPVYKFHVLLDEDRLIMAGSPDVTDPLFVAIKTRIPTAVLVSLTHDLPTFRLGYVLSADGATATRPPLSYIVPPDRRRAVYSWAAKEYRSLRLEGRLRPIVRTSLSVTSAVSTDDAQSGRGFAWLLIVTLAACETPANLRGAAWTAIEGTLARTAAAHIAWADALPYRTDVPNGANSVQYGTTISHMAQGRFYAWKASTGDLVELASVVITDDLLAAAKLRLSE